MITLRSICGRRVSRAQERDEKRIEGWRQEQWPTLSNKESGHTLVFADEAAFLKRLLADVPGPIELIWDNLNAHKSPEVRQIAAANPRLTLHYLPPYAPDLNPVEPLWSQAKHHRMANHAIDDLATLEQTARGHIAAIASEQRLLQGCFASAGLPLAL